VLAIATIIGRYCPGLEARHGTVNVMARAMMPVHYDQHLTLVEHLDELRTRIFVSLGFVAVAFAVCFWQHDALLNLLNHPLSKELSKLNAKGLGTQGQIGTAWAGIHDLGNTVNKILGVLANPSSHLPATTRNQLAAFQPQLHHQLNAVPTSPPAAQPTTIGIGEPFTVTVMVCFYFALLASLPVILFQLYSYILPAFSPHERNVVMPVMLTVPFLFVAGLLFGYEIVLPAAVHFLQGFNAASFNQLVQAQSYYSFAALLLLAMGVIFQVPLFVVALSRAGIVTTRQLRHNRRYAIVLAALVAALLPGDAITMILETLPIIILYEVGIWVSVALDHRDARRERARARSAAGGTPPPPPPPIPFGDAF
jgi:sec-independent protein translocase protein TatC